MLDLDNTLFDFDRAEERALLETAAKFHTPEDFITCYKTINKALWKDLEKGLISSEALKILRFSKVVETLNMRSDAQNMSAYYIERLGEGADLLPFAKELCESLSKKVRLAAVTNGIQDVQTRRIHKSGLEKWFQVVVVSESIGFSKPDPKIFEAVLNKMGHAEKQSVLMIGDSIKADIQGAQSAGIDTCWVNLKRETYVGHIKPTYEVFKLEEILACF